MTPVDARTKARDPNGGDIAPHSAWLTRIIMTLGLAAIVSVVATAVMWSTTPAGAGTAPHRPAAALDHRQGRPTGLDGHG